MKEQIITEDGWRSYLKIKLHSRYISSRLRKRDKSTRYRFMFKDKDRSVDVSIVDMVKETENHVDFDQLRGNDSALTRRFIRHYMLEYIKVVFEELLKGHSVYIGNNIFMLSLYTTVKKYMRLDVMHTLKTIRMEIHPKLTTIRKRKAKYMVKVDKDFKKKSKKLKKKIFYYKYPIKVIR